jgi:hypothetical protein
MEGQPSMSESASLLNTRRIRESKHLAIFSTSTNFIMSGMLVAIFQIRWSRMPIHSGLDEFSEIFVVALLLLLPLFSLISAWTLSRWVTSDPVFRKAFMWTILRGISQILFFTYLILLQANMLRKS